MSSKFKFVLALITIPTLSSVGATATANFYLHHNVDKYSGGRRTIASMDGIIANTTISVYQDDLLIQKYDPFGEGRWHYYDANLDGKIDLIRKESPFFDSDFVVEDFYRNDETKDLFQKADQIYQELREKYKIKITHNL